MMELQVKVGLGEDEALSITQLYRQRVINALAPDGEIPTNTDDKILLLQTLDGMDRQALTLKRLKNDASVGDNMARAAVLVQSVLDRFGNGDPFAVGRRGVKVLNHPEKLSEVRALPGELEQGISVIDLDDILVTDSDA